MSMDRPVVVAVDLGVRSRIALAQGYAAAERDGCALVVVHVLPPTLLAAPLFPQQNADHALDGVQLRIATMTAMEQLVDQVPRGSRVGVQLELRGGEVANALIELVARVQARLLVISSATHELGATTAAVMRGAPCPVLVARDLDGVGPVLAATDLSDPSMPAITAAAALARAEEVALHAIHVVEPWMSSTMRLQQIGMAMPYTLSEQVSILAVRVTREVGRLGVTAVVHTPVGLPATEVVKLARETHCRLLVVGTVRRARLWRFLAGSLAEDIVRRAPCSVLVTRLHGRDVGTEDVGAAGAYGS